MIDRTHPGAASTAALLVCSLACSLAAPVMAAPVMAVPVMAVPVMAAEGPAKDGWAGYPVIVWQDQTPARAAGLRRLGVDAGRVFGARGPLDPDTANARAASLRAAGMGFYVENIATDFYAAYHRWRPDHPVTWAFDQARALPRDDPAAYLRAPSLSDARALAAIQARLARHVALFGPYRPLFYDLGDETGIADLAAAWDFDLGPESLAGMRDWLRGQYGTLAALNAQWGTGFADWDAAAPMTTDAAIAGPDGNFSAWADFKAWMDVAFARAVQAGADAVHSADPRALAGIEGAQIPGWGGYDYSRLAPAADVMEIYDAGDNVEIARAMNPALRILTTTAPAAGMDVAAERARLWHELLLGNRGVIVWDEARALVGEDGAPSPLGRSFAALFADLRAAAPRLAAATPAVDPVAILYSPASFRIAWLLDRRAEHAAGGPDWRARGSEIEGQDSPLRASMRLAAAGPIHWGFQPRWVAEDRLAETLRDARALLLPRAIALSPEAVAAIAAFARRGGLVLADTPPGLFDAHGRRRATPPLTDAVTPMPGWDAAAVADRLRAAGVTPPLTLTRPDGVTATDIDIRLWHDGAATLIGLQRDGGAAAEDVVLTLPRPARLVDLRQGRPLGRTDRIVLRVGAAEPMVLSATP